MCFHTREVEFDSQQLTTKESPISTTLSGPHESPSDQSTSWPSPKSDKGKAKRSEYEDSDGNELDHSLNNEYGGLDVAIMRTPGANKEFTKTSEQPSLSTQEKNVVNRFGYNDYMAYHYAFMMKMEAVREC